MAAQKGNRERPTTVAFRLTVAERRLVEAAAAGAGMLLSDYMRATIMPVVREQVQRMASAGNADGRA